MANVKDRKSKPQWFGSAVTAATDGSPQIQYSPFPQELRTIIAPHIEKATKRRQQALDAIRLATSEEKYDALMKNYRESPLSREGHLSFDTSRYLLREAFLASCGAPESTDLTTLHDSSNTMNKLDLLKHLTEHPQRLQTVYDEFVRGVCCPRLAELWDCQGEIYYQAFPCIRMVQPGEFSIGPHADVAYGHHPFTTNFYVLLTDLSNEESSAALFLESQMGQEDWHPILGQYGSMVKHFPGAVCAHWTTENNTPMTRVSLDFRLLPGPLYHAMMDGGQQQGGQLDVFRRTEGYYSCCRLEEKATPNGEDSATPTWERIGPLQAPDARVGFPWTVHNWDKFMAKNAK